MAEIAPWKRHPITNLTMLQMLQALQALDLIMKTEKNSLNAVFLRLYCAIIVTTYIKILYKESYME